MSEGQGPTPENLGTLVRQYRQALGLSQEELADRSRLSVRAIGNIERGRTTRPHRHSVQSLGDALVLPDSQRRELDRAARVPAQGVHATAAETKSLPVPHQLPASVAGFVGRERELEEMTGLLDSAEKAHSTVVTAIVGTAGVGKTALAVQWAHQVAARFPDGQLYVNLRGFDPGQPMPASNALAAFLRALGVTGHDIPAEQHERAARYRSLLSGRQVLVVLDNAWDDRQVRPLLPGGPGCLVLVTSRNQLAGLVATEGAHPVTLGVLSEADANQLLGQRIGAERMSGEPDAAAELIALCARLPLALAIAAARASLHSGWALAALATELRATRGRLDGLDAGEAASSVRAAFSWSFRHVPLRTARVFWLLGVHPGPDITVAATASLAGLAVGEAGRVLRELTRANLLVEEKPGRFAFHDLLRAYAAELAGAQKSAGEGQIAIHRMLDHYLHTADTAGLVVSPNREEITVERPLPGVLPEEVASYEQAMAWFEAEHAVLMAALRLASNAGLYTHAWKLPTKLTPFFYRRGHWDSYLIAHKTGLAAAVRLGDVRAQALARRNVGTAHWLLGHYEEAQTFLAQALSLFRQVGDRAGEGRTHNALAMLFEGIGQHNESIGHCLLALSLFESVGDRQWQATMLNNIGWFQAQLGDYEQALIRCQQALTMLQDIGDRNAQAYVWDSIGFAHEHLGHHDEAVDCYEHALALALQLDDRLNQAKILTNLGDAHHAAGREHAARDCWEQALALFDDLQHPSADTLRAKLRHAD